MEEPPKDLHYLVTRIINPTLNTVIATLTSYEAKTLKYREDYAIVKAHSPPMLVAKELQGWRDDLFREYNNNNVIKGETDIVKEYKQLVDYTYSKLHSFDKDLAKVVLEDLFDLGRTIEKYLTGNVNTFAYVHFFDEVKTLKTQVEEIKREMDNKLTKLNNEMNNKVKQLEERLKEAKSKSFKLGLVTGLGIGIALLIITSYFL
ncbi:MAG: hypothetical protein ACTSWZ_02135 [Candidatus Heimdallarchaeaceae archaeon]